ncbi:unnamed protein product, partial [Ixodes persulcatus]
MTRTSRVIRVSGRVDAVPSSTTQPEEEQVGSEDLDSGASSAAPRSTCSPELATTSAAARRSPPTSGPAASSSSLLSPGLPLGTLPSSAALSELQAAGAAAHSALPFLRGPLTLLPRPLLWWPLAEGMSWRAREQRRRSARTWGRAWCPILCSMI